MSYSGHSSSLDVTVPIDTNSLINGVLKMKPLHRSSVSKHTSAAQFRRNVGRTKVANIVAGPMRGGIRL